jgi:hypothetical protein
VVLAEPETDAANISTALFELFDLWSEAFEAASLELCLEFWSAGGHDDGFAGADEVAGEAFDTLGWVDENLVDICNSLEFGARSFVESLWAVSNRMLVNNTEREVEIVEEAVAAARENAASNGLTNCRFLAGDVLRVLDELTARPDVIVLDPPRDGVHPKALPRILAYEAGRILYISCKPTSLARDLPFILSQGYNIEEICCVDMFPGTVHCEVICSLKRIDNGQHLQQESAD